MMTLSDAVFVWSTTYAAIMVRQRRRSPTFLLASEGMRKFDGIVIVLIVYCSIHLASFAQLVHLRSKSMD